MSFLLIGSGYKALFNSPCSCLVSPSNILYISDYNNRAVRSIILNSEVKTVSTLFGGGPSGCSIDSSANPILSTGIFSIQWLTDTPDEINSYSMLIIDYSNTIRDYNLQYGTISLVAGQCGTSGYADGNKLSNIFYTTDITFTCSKCNIFSYYSLLSFPVFVLYRYVHLFCWMCMVMAMLLLLFFVFAFSAQGVGSNGIIKF